MNIELFLSILAVVISAIAIYVSVALSHEQNKIALIEKRMELFDKIENYVRCLGSWEFKLDWFLKLNLSETQVEALFDKDFLEYYKQLAEDSERISKLWGDCEHAKNNGNYKGKDEDEIELEIRNIVQSETMKFNILKGNVYKKFFSVKK